MRGQRTPRAPATASPQPQSNDMDRPTTATRGPLWAPSASDFEIAGQKCGWSVPNAAAGIPKVRKRRGALRNITTQLDAFGRVIISTHHAIVYLCAQGEGLRTPVMLTFMKRVFGRQPVSVAPASCCVPASIARLSACTTAARCIGSRHVSVFQRLVSLLDVSCRLLRLGCSTPSEP